MEKKKYTTPILQKIDSISKLTKVKKNTQRDGQSNNYNFGTAS